ncbi:arginyltransferase [Natronospira bacteriovora]|uniref:Aspartate/glutamate leucyltransferase n=1 Tax=Natronospira bacteriovora TaxID=3069753 RepID=A0ABU0W9S3_9GAMM|nr:arginyltransferase [Natronospira sp. AB-CW4]MDQ2070712.1 arginyltransferase [Natronospira sp. AB-CW4]
MKGERQPRLLLTAEQDCPYREGLQARNIVLEPGSVRDRADHTAFSSIGFRRSGEFLYRPHCRHCKACIPTRIPVRDFQWRRRHRRCLKRNSDLSVDTRPVTFDEEAYSLYQRYQRLRHGDGPMAEGDEHDYMGFIRSQWADTRMSHFRLDGQLLMVVISDWLEDGLSAVYTYFDPDLTHRSLGQYGILWQIEQVREAGLPYVYLGYWVQESPKMRYKTDYRPIEMMIEGHWQSLST